jgi:hypothetical protein
MVEFEHVLENPQHLPPKEATHLLPLEKDVPISYQASQPCSQRQPVYGFEPGILFGTKVVTIKFFCFEIWAGLTIALAPTPERLKVGWLF